MKRQSRERITLQTWMHTGMHYKRRWQRGSRATFNSLSFLWVYLRFFTFGWCPCNCLPKPFYFKSWSFIFIFSLLKSWRYLICSRAAVSGSWEDVEILYNTSCRIQTAELELKEGKSNVRVLYKMCNGFFKIHFNKWMKVSYCLSCNYLVISLNVLHEM